MKLKKYFLREQWPDVQKAVETVKCWENEFSNIRGKPLEKVKKISENLSEARDRYHKALSQRLEIHALKDNAAKGWPPALSLS